jgi:glycosyltransferase involved in cell wall biosynthesis
MSKQYCIFSAQYYPHVGGVERYTLYLSRKLIEAGNKVTIVTSNTGSLSGDEVQDNIQIYRLPCYDLLHGRYPVFKKNQEFKRVEKLLREQQYDFVIINTRFYLHSLYGAKFAKSRGIPAIVIEHGTSHLSVNNKLFDTVGGWYEHFLTFLLKKYCKNYYGVSEACCEWSGHFHIKSKGTLYNAVEIEEFQKILGESQIDYRKKYMIPEESRVISFTGRLIPEKGIRQLVSAVKAINLNRIENKQLPVYLVIAGDGPLYREIQKISDSYTIMTGQIDFEHIVKLLDTSDIFCLPSDSEGFPTSVLEAVACKCFVITTYQGGARELLINEEYGIIMKDNTTELIQENLEKVLENDTYRLRAEEKSYERLVQYFTWNATAKKVMQIAEKMNGEKE